MKHTLFNKPTLFLTVCLMLVAVAVGVSAYGEPIAPWPVNTTEPIDTGMTNQAKVGPLSVTTFFARGNADFKKDLTIEGVAQGGDPTITTNTSVQITSNVLATGDLRSGSLGGVATAHLSAQNITHGEPQPKAVCADTNGIVVFCKDVCNNINGEQSEPPTGYTANTDGSCTALPDLCSNVPGIQQTLNADLSIDDSSQPTFCTQTIRGTIYAGLWGNIVRNMANTAMLGDLALKEIKITSIGGDPTQTVWPAGLPPLRFNWSACSSWNPAYTGPTIYNSLGGGSPSNAIGGSVANGECFDFRPDFAHISTLPYGFLKDMPQNGLYTAWDGVSTPPPSTSVVSGVTRYLEYSKGFFDADRYDAVGSKTSRPKNYGALTIFVQKNQSTESWMNIKMPLERLILTNVKVPVGYKLVLGTDPIKSPGTVVDMYMSDNANTVTVASPLPGYSAGVYVSTPGYNSGLPISVPPGVSREFPNGTYSAFVICTSGSRPSKSFTLPHSGGTTLSFTCQ